MRRQDAPGSPMSKPGHAQRSLPNARREEHRTKNEKRPSTLAKSALATRKIQP